MNKTKVSVKENTPRNKFIFKIITVIIPVIILLAFEIILSVSGYGDNFDLFIQNPTEGYEKYMMVNPEVGKKYFQKFEYTAPANDIFLAEKPENSFRIFVMGSSTVYGFPYERNLMFSRILHQQLEDAFPDKKIEIVNTAITAINSFTLLDYTDEIVEYKPDAVLIYAGHNEFYGAFGIGSNETMSKYRSLTKLHLSLMNLKLYQLLRNIIGSVSQKIASGKEVHGTLMKRMVADTDIILHSEEYQIAMENYRENMDEILHKIRRKNIPVFISELVSNIYGMEPFNSVKNDELEGADEVFLQAKEAEKNQDFETALGLFYKAKDLDCVRFRASEDVNKIVNELAEKHEAIKIPMLDRFQNQSPNQLIGNNLMTEHVHPNIDGNFIMANAFLSQIIQSKILGEPGELLQTTDYYKKNYGYTALDSLLAVHRVQSLKGYWPFVKEAKNEINYRLVYRPKNYLDSLAFSAMKDPDLILAEVRLDLARYYDKSGQIAKAYKEYESLLRINPYVGVNYRDAATCLLKLQDLPLALKYFQKSLEYQESFLALYRIGEIYLLKGDYNKSFLFFEKSFSVAPDDRKVNVLVKSYMAAVYGRNLKRTKAIAEELKRVNASQYLRVPPPKYTYQDYIPFQTKEQVNAAKELLNENKLDEALTVLESSLKIYDSHVANRLIGEICAKQQNNEKALFYLKKVYGQYQFDPQFLYDFALIYHKENESVNANKCLQEIKEIDPEFENLEKLTDILSKPS